MHEFSVIASIMELIKSEMEKAKASRVLEVQLEVGELSFLSHESLRFGFKALAENEKGIEPEGLKIITVPAQVKCRKCDYSGPLMVEDTSLGHLGSPVFQCPKCQGPVEVMKGRDCIVKNLRMEVDD